MAGTPRAHSRPDRHGHAQRHVLRRQALLLAAAGAAGAVLAAADTEECVDDFTGLSMYARDFLHQLPGIEGGCSRLSTLCSDAMYGPLVSLYCPASCGTCTQSREFLDSDRAGRHSVEVAMQQEVLHPQDPALCLDNETTLGRAYKTCADAKPHCLHPTYGKFVRDRCPQSCGHCGMVELEFVVANITHDLVVFSAGSEYTLTVAIQQALASMLPLGVEPDHIVPKFSSVGLATHVDALITTKVSTTAVEVLNFLNESASNMELHLGAMLRNESLLTQLAGPFNLLAVVNFTVIMATPAITPPPKPEEVEIVNCSDQDASLAEWASSVDLSLRGCLDLAATVLDPLEDFFLPPFSLEPTGDYCSHLFFGPAVRRLCPATCLLCSRPPDSGRPLDVGGAPAVPPEVLEVGPDRVSFFIRVSNVDYAAIRANAEFLDIFEMEVKAAIVSQTGDKRITQAHIALELSAGSVLIQATITPPPDVGTRELQFRLRRSDSLGSTVAEYLQDSVDLRSVRTGSVQVEYISRFVVSPTPKPTASTCSAQSWAASSVAPARQYYISQLSGPWYGFTQCQEKCAERPGGRLISCIEDESKLEFLKEGALDGGPGIGALDVWVGLLQPRSQPDLEPIGGWSWTSGCDGYEGLWFSGWLSAPRQPDNLEHTFGTSLPVREDCAVLLHGYLNASHEAFDVPCAFYGRPDHVKAWLPDRCLCESPLNKAEAVPMCMPCRSPTFPPESACKYDISSCAALEPGESCTISCQAPYHNTATITATCPTANYNPFRVLEYSDELTCGCPEPPLTLGYDKRDDGAFECSPGYAGQPQVRCLCGRQPELYGCELMQHCVAPVVDNCRQDASDCEDMDKRYPGSSCIIRCRDKPSHYITARCPAGNIEFNRNMEYSPLRCPLEACTDPSNTVGYVKVNEEWVCSDGYFGAVRYECMPNTTGWYYPSCASVGTLSGCQAIVPCGPPPLNYEEDCKIDADGCTDVQPGSVCELKCQFPFEGEKRVGICPDGNVDPNGLVLNESLPVCTVITRECLGVEPVDIPGNYQKLLSGWQCNTGYTGFALKHCVPVPVTCQLDAVLSGCSQLTPCVYEDTDFAAFGLNPSSCMYNAYDCVSVQPGGTCQISCKAPYAGSIVMASCSSTNDRASGLSLKEGLPTCIVTGCSDPWPWPTGYSRTEAGWECGSSFTHSGRGVVKSCVPSDDGGCSSSSTLSGCEPEEPCAPLVIKDACWLNASECGNVPSGSRCAIRCRNGWRGVPGIATCPESNIDRTTLLRPTFPVCECEEPYPAPPEYVWSKDTKRWLCAPGYAGEADKVCLPGPNCTTVPTLQGCSAPVPCDVAPWEDKGSVRDRLIGTLRFGPAKVGLEIDETEVLRYNIYFGDSMCAAFNDPIAMVPKGRRIHTCCRDDAYEVAIDVEPIAGSTQLLIIPETARGETPDAGVLELESILGATSVKVQFRLAVRNIGYTELLAQPMIKFRFEVAIKEAVAIEADPQRRLRPGHIDLQLSAGSVWVFVTITPPFGTDTADVQRALEANPSALRTAIQQKLESVESLAQITTGPIRIDSMSSPRVTYPGTPQPVAAAAVPRSRPWWILDRRMSLGAALPWLLGLAGALHARTT